MSYAPRVTSRVPTAEWRAQLQRLTVAAYALVVPCAIAMHSLHAQILGPQAQHRTEYLQTPRHEEYMAYPRLVALAEVVWTERARRDHANFRARLNAHMQRLRAMSVNARPLDVVP